MKHRDSFFKRIATLLNLNGEATAKERLEDFIKDQKHLTLLERIKAIRTNSYFVPDYDKPKVFTEVVIMYKENPNDEFKPINHNVVLTQQRPEDFGNDIKAWKKFMNRDHKKATTPEMLKQKEEQFQSKMKEKYEKLQPFFNRMMRVD
jgi:hypothetical protein